MILRNLSVVALLCAMSTSAQLNIGFLGEYDYQAARNSDLSNLWGYVDEFGNEYALVGVNGENGVPNSGGFSVVDVTDPANPVEVFFTPGPNSIWREIKSWGDHAYMTTEAEAGLYIIDLTPLPSGTPVVTLFNGNGWDTSHSLFIDENGRLYLHGSNRGNGGVIMYDLTQDPMNPVEVGEFDQWYCHDSFARGDTLYAAHINNGFFSVVDVSDPSNPVLLGTQTTPNAFTHNTWLDDSGQYLFTTDEKPNSYVGAYDVSDPSDIVEVDRLQTSPGSTAIVHNTYWLNDYVVQSYYTEGVSIYDVSDPTNMVEVGHYDTSPFTGNTFDGAWGVYPYLPSGNLLISDIQEGLIILAPTYVRGCYLEGLVTDVVTSAPINNATVSVIGTILTTTTGFPGTYSTGYHTPGTYIVEVSAPGYLPSTAFGVVLQTGQVTVLDVALEPLPTFAIDGSVVTLGTTDGVPNAQLLFDNGLQQYAVVADVNGVFVTPALPEGNYNVYVGSWGWQPLCLSLVVDQFAVSQIYELEPGYADDFSLDLGWSTASQGTSGDWERGVPVGTTYQNQPCNPGLDVSDDCGDQAYVTGNGGGSAGDDDVDGGPVELFSPVFDVSAMADPHIRYTTWFFNGGGMGTPNDNFQIALTNGTDTVDIDVLTMNNTTMATWVDTLVRISEVLTPSATMQLLLRVTDDQPGHLVEGGLDDFGVLADPFAGTDELSRKEAVLWPNPGTDQLNVVARQGEVLNVIDLQGRSVAGPLTLREGVNTLTLAPAAGAYVVRITAADGMRSARWVVN